MTYLIVLVDFIHTSITFIFCDDLSCVLYNDLVGLKAAVCAHSIATVCSLDDFDSYPILAALGASILKVLECTIRTVLAAKGAVSIITLIKHDPVLAVITTAAGYRANTA
jgi:hypothetical protein